MRHTRVIPRDLLPVQVAYEWSVLVSYVLNPFGSMDEHHLHGTKTANDFGISQYAEHEHLVILKHPRKIFIREAVLLLKSKSGN
jgi:hypothetical protein